MEFDIQSLHFGGGMAQAGYGTSVNYTCSYMSSGPSVYKTRGHSTFASEALNQACPNYLIFPSPSEKSGTLPINTSCGRLFSLALDKHQ